MTKHILLLSLLSVILLGQSPYNRLGYGSFDKVVDPFGSSSGIGVIATRDSVRASIHNPAALNGLEKVHFGASVTSDYTSSNERLSNLTRIEQVNLVLPLGSNYGASIGVQAYSDFGSEYEASIPEGTLTENSSGGIWDYHLGLGYAINAKHSVGIKLHMLQGIFRRELQLYEQDYAALYVLKGNISGRSLEFGALSRINDKISVGLTVNYPYAKPNLSGIDSLAGTSSAVEYEEEFSAWPIITELGLSYQYSGNTRILAGVRSEMVSETGFEEAVLFALPDGWTAVPSNTFEISYQHLASDHSSRFVGKRVGWQVGLSVKNHYIAPENGDFIYEYALISGLTLGLRNGKSLFDISGEFGSKQGVDTLPDELFARVKFGIQVSDTWFRKVKRR